MFKLVVIGVCLLALSVNGKLKTDSAVDAYRPCEISDVKCIREDISLRFMGLTVPIEGDGPDCYYDYYPLKLTLPSFNVEMDFPENTFGGFLTGVITDYYILPTYDTTVVDIYFDYITIDSVYELTITDMEVTGSKVVVPGTGFSTLHNVTMHVAFPGIDFLDEENVVTTMDSLGSFDFSSLEEYAEHDKLTADFLQKYNDNLELFLAEFNDQMDDRVAHWYFLTNVGSFDLDH